MAVSALSQSLGMAATPVRNVHCRFGHPPHTSCRPGLNGATALLEPIKAKFPEVSYADLYQMASALAIEVCTSVLCTCYHFNNPRT